jgi:sugar transferase (PEP-CTERM/EpsH1 system associated)
MSCQTQMFLPANAESQHQNPAAHRGADGPGSATVEHDKATDKRFEPLRVLHVINSLGVGGTERGVLKVMDGMDRRHFEHRLCAIRGFDPELAESESVRGRLLTAGPNVRGFQFLVFRLMRVMRMYKPHIVHSRNWGAIEAVPAARLAGVPVVIHSEHGYELDMLSGLPLRRRLLRRFFYPLCDAFFTVSYDLRNYHSRESWLSPDRVRVVPNGVDTRLFAPNTATRSQMRGRLCIPPQSIVLGSVGRMVPIKDHQTLLQAAELLIESGSDVRVLLVGGGSESERHREYAKASARLNGRVILIDSQLDVSELYQAMDIFVLPSICEGMSNTLLEAMASGLPCVATNVGGNTELLSDSSFGYLFAPKDVAGLATQLGRLIKEPGLRAQFAAVGRQEAVTRFSLDRMIGDYTNLYYDLATKRGAVSRN